MKHTTERTRAFVALLAALTVAACSGGEDTVPLQEIKVQVGITEDIAGIDVMRWRMTPTILTREDGHTESVLTDDYGHNSDATYTDASTSCSTDPQSGTQTCERCTTDAKGARTCSTFTRTQFVNVMAIGRNLLAGPIPLSTLVNGVVIEQGVYTSFTVTAIAQPNVRDTYIQLADGRECEVRLQSADGRQSITVPMHLTVGRREDYTIRMRLALTHNIDPARCAEGYVIQAAPASVEITRTPVSELYHGNY